MYSPQILQEKVIVTPDEIKFYKKTLIDKDELINTILINKVKEEYGDKCISNGYLKKESIELLERSIGKIYAEHLNGNIMYNVRFRADICNPIKGMEVKAIVENVNKMGVMAKAKPLTIILARQHHVNRKSFKNIKVGQEITLNIVGSRFELNDKEISVIGYLSDSYGEDLEHESETMSEMDDDTDVTSTMTATTAGEEEFF